MDAAADYAAAARALSRHLPAYVSYAVHSRVVAGPVDRSETARIVVRSRDGKIVKGNAPQLHVGSDSTLAGDVVVHPPFDPACYVATGARTATFAGSAVEALTLRGTCRGAQSSKLDFSTLYVSASHDPVAAVGGDEEAGVAVTVEQRFVRAGGYVVPAAVDVHVKGRGLMFWLDVQGHQSYDAFGFSDDAPA